jgi:hypothetical protein
MTELLPLRDQAFADLTKGDRSGILAYADYLQENDLPYWKEISTVDEAVSDLELSGGKWYAGTAFNAYIARCLLGVSNYAPGNELLIASDTALRTAQSAEVHEFMYYHEPCVRLTSSGNLMCYGLPDHLYRFRVLISDQHVLPGHFAIVYNPTSERAVAISLTC